MPGKTEGQPHASPPELATDTLGQSVRLVSDGRTRRISTPEYLAVQRK